MRICTCTLYPRTSCRILLCRRSDFILKILPPRADKVLDSTGDSAEVQQEESKHSTSASAGVEDIEIQVPVSTKWKELSWESPESSPVSIDSNRDASTKEQQRSDRTGLRELNPSESSTRDTTELQMFVDEDEEDEPQDTSVNFTPPVLAKESSRRRPGKEAPKSSTLYDEDDYY